MTAPTDWPPPVLRAFDPHAPPADTVPFELTDDERQRARNGLRRLRARLEEANAVARAAAAKPQEPTR